jgi:hypothetical protein
MGQTEKSRRLLNAEATHSIGVAKIEILGRLGCEAVQSRDWNEVEKVIAEIRAETRLPPVNFLEPPLVWKLDRAKRCWSALLEGKLALGKGQLDLAIVGLEDCRRVILADSPGHDGLQALTAWVQTNLSLAGAYDQKGDIARAIPCLQFVLDKKAHLIKDSWETMDYFQAMQSMISLLEKTGRRVEADRYRMEKRNFRPGNR